MVGVAIIGVIGVVGVEVFRKEFWPSLCKDALLLCSLPDCIAAFLVQVHLEYCEDACTHSAALQCFDCCVV